MSKIKQKFFYAMYLLNKPSDRDEYRDLWFFRTILFLVVVPIYFTYVNIKPTLVDTGVIAECDSYIPSQKEINAKVTLKNGSTLNISISFCVVGRNGEVFKTKYFISRWSEYSFHWNR